MTKRTTEAYSAVFDFIEKTLFKLNPSRMMTDFESASRKGKENEEKQKLR